MLPDVLVPLGPDGDRPPLYCLHSASGSCHTYLPLARLLDHRPVIGIEAPGYDGGEAFEGSLVELADAYAKTIDVDRAGRPACLLGWSTGGVLALETAARLRAVGCPVPLVVLVDAYVPQDEPTPTEQMIRARFVAGFAADSLDLLRERSAATLRVWAEEGAGADAWEPLRARGWLPDELDSETLDERFAVFRAHVRALEPHRVAPGHPGPVLVVRARESPPETRRWSELIDDVREVTLPGDHHSMWQPEGLAELARVVGEALRGAAPGREER